MMPVVFPLPPSATPRVRDTYGAERHGVEAGHRAIDLVAPEGTPIFSTVDGEVIPSASLRAPSGYSGWGVSVRDADGWVHHYAHMRDRPMVRAGDRVRAGQQLGLVGRTGSAASTGPHLHYQITRPGNRRVNPTRTLLELFLRAQGRDLGNGEIEAMRERWRANYPLADAIAHTTITDRVLDGIAAALGEQAMADRILFRAAIMTARLELVRSELAQSRGDWREAHGALEAAMPWIQRATQASEAFASRLPQALRAPIARMVRTWRTLEATARAQAPFVAQVTREAATDVAELPADAARAAAGIVPVVLLVGAGGAILWAMTRR